MWKLFFTLFIIFYSQCFGQEAYNSCDLALELCPGKTVEINNVAANHTICGGCEDDFTTCFVPNNSIWLKFTTNNDGGSAAIVFSAINFIAEAGRDNRFNAIVFSAGVPCNAVSYAQVGNCLQNANSTSTITLGNLTPNRTYFVCISGTLNTGFTLPATFTMDCNISGPAVDRPVPIVFASLNTTICPNELVYAIADTQNCPDKGQYRWYIDDVLVAVTTDSLFYSSNFRNGSILKVETECYTVCREVITFASQPLQVIGITIDAGADKTIAKGGSIKLESTIPPFTLINWTPSFSLSDPTSRAPIASPSETTIYTLEVTDTATGCKIYDYVTVIVKEGIVVTNTFSPNDDGINDTWYIQGLENYPNNEIKIYSRWGQMVFEARNFGEQKAWNGKVAMGGLQESVYFFVLELNDPEGTEIKGSITLLR